MPEQRIDVFISSTSRDLKKYRDKVKDTVLNAGAFPIAMEEFDATERNALQKCYDEVCKAEIFVGIYAHRYGFAPGEDMNFTTDDGETRVGDGVTGITEWEYKWAVERKLPMLLYVVADVDDEGEPLPWVLSYIDGEPGRSRLAAFKQAIMGTHVVGFFQSPDDLARQIAGALPKLLDKFEADNAPTLPAGRRDFYRHVNLPANFIPRPELLTEIRAALLARDDGLALHGMGGIGKSVMARALCDDSAVQAAFPDGILWVSLGQDVREDDVRTRLRAWVETLGGVIGESAPSIERLKETLAALLAARCCLLIIDDVWRRRDAEHFRVGGAACRLLITTRDAEVGHSLGVPVHTIPLMTYAEAAALLDQWSDGTLASTSDTVKRRIINDTLGRLPLAIRLAGAQLRGRSATEWQKAFNARRLEARRPESVHDSLALTFGLSLDALHAADRKLYAALAIFKEDEPIHEAAILRLWSGLDGLDKSAAVELIDDLAARALLEVAANTTPREVILHDLLRDFVSAELTDPVAAHRALLDAYREQAQVKGWHAVPDDGYLYNHLVYHLAAMGDYAAIRDLFMTDDWLNARVPAAGFVYDGYVADLETAWFQFAEPLAEQQISAGDASFSTCVDLARYALIRTTINSLASNHVRGLVVRAVQYRLEGWTHDRAVSIAQHVSNPLSRALFFELMLYELNNIYGPNGPWFQVALSQGLDAARAVREPALQVERLAALLPRLERRDPVNPDERPALIAEIMNLLDTVTENRSSAFASVVRHFDDPAFEARRDRLFSELMGAHHHRTRAAGLIAIAQRLSPAQKAAVFDLFKRTPGVDSFTNERQFIDILQEIRPVPDDQLPAVQAIIDSFRFAGFRAHAYGLVAEYVVPSDPERAAWVQRARESLNEEMDWGVAIPALAQFSWLARWYGHERDEVLARAFAITEGIGSHRSRVRALTTLAEWLQREDTRWVDYCFEQAKALYVDDDLQADLLIALAGKLNDADLEYVVTVISAAMEDRSARARLLEAHAPHLKAKLLTEALRLTYMVKDERAQIESIASLGRSLPADERQAAFSRALELAQNIRDERNRGRAVGPLIASVDGDLLTRALDIARETPEPAAAIRIIPTLIERMTDDLLPVTLEIAYGITDPGSKIEALTLLYDYISEDERLELVKRATAGRERTLRSVAYLAIYDARRAETDESRASHVARAVEIALRIPSPVIRAWTVAEITAEFPGAVTSEAVEQTLQTVLVVRNQWNRGAALAALAVVLNEEQRSRALKVIGTLKDPWSRVWALAAFANQKDHAADPTLVAELRRFLVTYLHNRTDVKRESKLQFLTARAIYRAPTFDRDTLAELARVVMAICWDWRWL